MEGGATQPAHAVKGKQVLASALYPSPPRLHVGAQHAELHARRKTSLENRSAIPRRAVIARREPRGWGVSVSRAPTAHQLPSAHRYHAERCRPLLTLPGPGRVRRAYGPHRTARAPRFPAALAARRRRGPPVPPDGPPPRLDGRSTWSTPRRRERSAAPARIMCAVCLSVSCGVWSWCAYRPRAARVA